MPKEKKRNISGSYFRLHGVDITHSHSWHTSANVWRANEMFVGNWIHSFVSQEEQHDAGAPSNCNIWKLAFKIVIGTQRVFAGSIRDQSRAMVASANARFQRQNPILNVNKSTLTKLSACFSLQGRSLLKPQ